jgi:hypothetical protein
MGRTFRVQAASNARHHLPGDDEDVAHALRVVFALPFADPRLRVCARPAGLANTFCGLPRKRVHMIVNAARTSAHATSQHILTDGLTGIRATETARGQCLVTQLPLWYVSE